MLIYYKPYSEDNENSVLPGVLINIFEVIEEWHGRKRKSTLMYIYVVLNNNFVIRFVQRHS